MQKRESLPRAGRAKAPAGEKREQKLPTTSPETLRLMRSVEHPGEFSAEDEEAALHPPPANRARKPRRN